MGFFASGDKKTTKAGALPSTQMLHSLECRACPLDKRRCNTPKMEPEGTKEPLVYILGDCPNEDADAAGRPFAGFAERTIRRELPDGFARKVRWSNVIRTNPPGGRFKPEPIELECCRPSVIRDIERARPKAIFGFGESVLNWATGHNRMASWRGRKLPVQIGKHVCWFYPFYHPDYLKSQHTRSGESPLDHIWRLDLQRAVKEVPSLPDPILHTPQDALAGVDFITGRRSGDLDKVIDFLEMAAAQQVSGFDYETTALRPYRKEAIILSAAVATFDKTLAFPFRHREAGWTEAQLRALEDAWMDYLRSRSIKAVHNLSFELEWSGFKFGEEIIRAGAIWADSCIQAFCLDERVGDRKPGCFALDFLIQQYFGLQLKKLSPLDKKRLGDEPLEDVLRYNGMDAKYHLLLWEAQRKRLIAENMEKVYQATVRRVPTVVLTMLRGVPVDQEEVEKQYKALTAQLAEAEEVVEKSSAARTFKSLTGRVFNPGSNPDVVKLCRDILKDQAGYKKDGGYSADEEVLSKIADPIGAAVLAVRRVNKLRSTYVLPLRKGGEYLYPDGRLHPILNTVYAETGRLSSEDPNEQNFPKRKGREIRKQVKAGKGKILVAIDYGQIEARVIAMASKDKNFVKALWERYDVHSEWAERIALAYPDRIGGKQNLKDKKIMKALRDDVKNQWTFPAFFGAAVPGIASYLHVPEDICKRLFVDFWKTFSGVKAWQEQTLEFYKKNGYVQYLTGRRRYGPLSPNQIFNSPIQGPTADLVLEAMESVSQRAMREGSDFQPIMQIHDDLTFEWDEDRADDHAEKVLDDMLAVSKKFDFINVPITLEMSVGADWCNMEAVGDFSSDKWNWEK